MNEYNFISIYFFSIGKNSLIVPIIYLYLIFAKSTIVLASLGGFLYKIGLLHHRL